MSYLYIYTHTHSLHTERQGTERNSDTTHVREEEQADRYQHGSMTPVVLVGGDIYLTAGVIIEITEHILKLHYR